MHKVHRLRVAEPFKAHAGIAVLRGSLAPDGAVIKPAAASAELLRHRGRALVFGPVADPAGVWGLGVLQLADDADPQEVVANDPVMKANAGFSYQVMPMLRAATPETC